MLYADRIFYGGVVFIGNESADLASAIAFKDGYVLATGEDEIVLRYAGDKTEKINLEGKFLMPGIIDSHMHPYWGAKTLATHSLGYEPLSVEQTLAKLREFLAAEPDAGADEWLICTSWLRIGGSDVFAADLDVLATSRPIMLFSNDCHFIALNSRGLALLGIDEHTPPPPDGAILRGEGNRPLGIIEDAPAMRYYDEVTKRNAEYAAQIARRAQAALNAQGITTVMDARADYEAFDTWQALARAGELSIRMVGAREITAQMAKREDYARKSLAEVLEFAARYDEPLWSPRPGLAVSHLKLFIDGMPTNNTAYVLEPYNVNLGTPEAPNWQPGTECGEPYFTPEQLEAIFCEAARCGVHPHMHVIADGAVQITCDAVAAMRAKYPHKDIRPANAHSDIMQPHQYALYAANGIFAVLSYQWCGQPQELIDYQRGLYGDVRFAGLETHGKFIDAGVCVAYGSDWPIDPLDEWGNFCAGLTRRIPGDAAAARLDNDRDLSVIEVLRSVGINAAKMLAKERYIGSLEAGKFADYIVLERDLLRVPPAEVRHTRVMLTAVGDQIVYGGL